MHLRGANNKGGALRVELGAFCSRFLGLETSAKMEEGWSYLSIPISVKEMPQGKEQNALNDYITCRRP